MAQELICLKDLVMEFGKDRVLDSINLSIEDKKFMTLLGPSGCGKTTTLRIIAGFQNPTSGEVFFDGQKINDVPPYKRQINTVFQNYALFPHLDVYDNIAFGLRISKLPEAEIDKRVGEMLEAVSLKGFENRKVTSLSGGQQQRVAIARALVNRPKVLLLDEPLGALDLRLRKDMQNELKAIQQEVGITAIYVTHDQSEAMALSDKIIIMNKGVVAQMGTPQEIYYHPVNEFVADFIGEANFLKGKMTGADGSFAVLDVEGNSLKVPARAGMSKGEEYTVVLRPEAATLADEGGMPCKVVLSCFMGSYQNYHVMVGNTLVKLEEHNPKNKRIYAVGEQCQLVFAPESVHVL